MSDETKDGGPAFPTDDYVPFPAGGGHRVRTGGMSLRDWFAGQALAGLIAAGAPRASGPGAIAHDAYLFADAMLKEREK